VTGLMSVLCTMNGRRSRPYFGSDNRGRTAAILASFVVTCNRLGIDPFTNLRDISARISAHKQTRLDELLLDKWQAARSVATS